MTSSLTTASKTASAEVAARQPLVGADGKVIIDHSPCPKAAQQTERANRREKDRVNGNIARKPGTRPAAKPIGPRTGPG